MFEILDLKPEAFGLDISDLSLKIAKLEKKHGELSLASFGEESIPAGIIRGGEIKKEDELAETIKKALCSVCGKRLGTKYVVVSLPEEKSFLQVIQMPRLPLEDLKSAIIYEAENYIPLPIEEIYLDSQIILPLQNHLDHYDVLIAALPRKTVNPYLSSLEKAGLKPVVFEIESLSVVRALVEKEISSSPILLIDFGATRASFIVFSGSSLRFTSSIPVSSQKLTESIARSLKISSEQAEQIKIEHGLEKKSTKKGTEVFDALIPVLTDLVEQIKKCLDYYQAHASHEHLPPNSNGVSKILLCGGGASLKGLTGFLSREFGLPVELGNPWINIGNPPLAEESKLPTKKEKLSFADSLRYTTALGLALRGASTKNKNQSYD